MYKQLADVFQEETNVVIAELDADAHRETAQEFGITGFPTLKVGERNDCVVVIIDMIMIMIMIIMVIMNITTFINITQQSINHSFIHSLTDLRQGRAS